MNQPTTGCTSYTKFHRTAPSCPNRHQVAPNYTNLHQVSGIPNMLHKVHQFAPNYTKFHRTTLTCPNLHQVAPSCTKLPQSAPSSTKFTQSAPSCPKLHQVEPTCIKLHQLHQVAPNFTKLPQSAPSCTNVHQVAPNCTKLHQGFFTQLHKFFDAVKEQWLISWRDYVYCSEEWHTRVATPISFLSLGGLLQSWAWYQTVWLMTFSINMLIGFSSGTTNSSTHINKKSTQMRFILKEPP